MFLAQHQIGAGERLGAIFWFQQTWFLDIGGWQSRTKTQFREINAVQIGRVSDENLTVVLRITDVQTPGAAAPFSNGLGQFTPGQMVVYGANK